MLHDSSEQESYLCNLIDIVIMIKTKLSNILHEVIFVKAMFLFSKQDNTTVRSALVKSNIFLLLPTMDVNVTVLLQIVEPGILNTDRKLTYYSHKNICSKEI